MRMRSGEQDRANCAGGVGELSKTVCGRRS